jgi:hypothetical protein
MKVKSSYYLISFIAEVIYWKDIYDLCILHSSKDCTIGPIRESFKKPNIYKLYKVKNYEN